MFSQVSVSHSVHGVISGPMSFPGLGGYGIFGTWSLLEVGMSRSVGMIGGGAVCQGGEYPSPLDIGYNGIWSASGQYTSYWNAFLL